MRIAIIGAGAAGLASARRAIEYKSECIVFEMTGNIGGTWVYNENTEVDEFNNPIHSSMYASLKVNLPVQLMEFTGYKFQSKSRTTCFPGHEEILRYIENFAEDYDLLRYIKFYHKVLNVSRVSNRWNVVVKNLKNDYTESYEFDAVMIGNGHHSKPCLPNIPGMETFKGYQIHSHCYRRNTSYQDKRVLIIGSGPSGLDISLDCSNVADKVYISCGRKSTKSALGKNVEKKTKVSSIEGDLIVFEDGTSANVDAIIYCTGYEYHFPFLDESCKIEIIEGKIIKPLYKSFFSILHPSMCFLGLLQTTIVFPLLDLQAEVFVKFLTNRIKLPSTEEMLETLEQENKKKSDEGVTKSCYYNLESNMRQYLEDLAHLGQIPLLPPVLFHIYAKNRETYQNNYIILKNQRFTILNEDTFLYSIEKEE